MSYHGSNSSSLGEDPATTTLLDANEHGTIQEQPAKQKTVSEHSALIPTPDQQPRAEEEEDPMDEGKCSTDPIKLLHSYRHMFVGCGFVVMFIIGTAYFPMLPIIKEKYFGSPQKAAGAQSIFDFTSAIIGLFTCFTYGKLQDTFGRKPFFVLFSLMQAVLVALLLAFPDNPLPYMIANIIAKLCAQSFIYAYLSDHFAPEKRSFVFGSGYASAGLASTALMMCAFLTQRTVTIVACCGAGLNILYAIFVVRESLPPEDVQPFSLSMIENPISPIIRMAKSKLMLAAMGALALVTFSLVGSGEVTNFYLIQRLHFEKADFATQMMIQGLLVPGVMLVILPLLLRFLSDVIVMVFCLIFIILSLVMLATAWDKWVIFAFVTPLGALAQMAGPVFMSIVSSTGDPQEQGQRLSAVTAVTDLFTAIGPLCFGQLYMHVHGGWVALPFVIAAAAVFPAAFLVFKMKKYREEERQVKRTASIIARSRSNTVAKTPPPEGLTCERAEQHE